MSGGGRKQRPPGGRSLLAARDRAAPLTEAEADLISEELPPLLEDLRLATGRCAACLSTSGERKVCHACRFVRYCNRECQTAGWTGHKLCCKVLAADRAISEAIGAAFPVSVPMLSLGDCWESLRSGSGGPAGAYAAASHIYTLWRRGDTAAALRGEEPSRALWAEMCPPDGIEVLVAHLAAGGLLTSRVAHLLATVAHGLPAVGAAVVAAGALPPLVAAVSLPGRNEGLGAHWGLFAASDSASEAIFALLEVRGRPMTDRRTDGLMAGPMADWMEDWWLAHLRPPRGA